MGTRGALAVAVLLVAAGCNPFSDATGRRSMTVEPDGPGSVFVRRSGDEIEITGRFSLAGGDIVRTASPGARILLASDRAASVATDSRVRITDGSSLEVLGGSVLAESPRHMTVAIDDVTATTSNGVLRVELFSASAGVAAYEGEVVIAAPGQERVTLGPLFDASVTAGEILSPKPYQVDVDDGWDRLHLADVVELDEQLDRYADAISGQLGRTRLPGSYFRGLEGRGAGQAMARYVESGVYSPPDLLIGFTIADLDESRARGRALLRAFDLREEGGQWGVIATIMGVRSGPLVAGLADLIFVAGALAAAPEGTAGPSNAGRGAGATRPGEAAGGAGSGRGGGEGGEGGEGNSEGGGDNAGSGSDGPSGDSGGSGETDEGGGSSPPAEEDCDNLIDCVIGILPLDTGLLP
jgi:hypothetical protein